MAIKRSEQGAAVWVLVVLVVAVAGAVWYAAIAVLLAAWLLVWAIGYLVVACMMPFEGTKGRRSRFVAKLGATPFERTRRFWLGAVTFGIWTRRHPAPVRSAPPQVALPPRPTRSAWGWVAGIVVGTVLIAGVTTSAATKDGEKVATSPVGATRPSPSLVVPSLTIPLPHPTKHSVKQHHAHHQKPIPHHTPRGATVASVCWTGNPLRGVYHSYRLDVLGTCRRYVGTVIAVRSESDGDHHVIIRPAHGYAGMLDHDNYLEQHGGIVAEIMPGQKLLPPYVGEHVVVVGTWAYDTNHGWNEIHPIWAMDYGQGLVKSLPPVKPVYEPGSSGGGGSGGTGGGGGGSGGSSDCTPGYSPCLVYHGGADYDCAGGSGSGPYYTAAGVTYRVSGSDPYGLDSDGDGLGCE